MNSSSKCTGYNTTQRASDKVSKACFGVHTRDYDGQEVSFFYNTGLDPNEGWLKVGPSVTPNWSKPPNLFVAGYAGTSGATKFVIYKIKYTPGKQCSLPVEVIR